MLRPESYRFTAEEIEEARSIGHVPQGPCATDCHHDPTGRYHGTYDSQDRANRVSVLIEERRCGAWVVANVCVNESYAGLF